MSCLADEFLCYRDSSRNMLYTDFEGRIIDCNESWLRTCGFEKDEVINKKNSILQGPLTERDAVEEINFGIRMRCPVEVIVTNFKKNGYPFKNRLTITPLEFGFLAEIEDLGISDYEVEYYRRVNV